MDLQLQGFLPAMRAGGWGRIVQIGAGEAVNPFPAMPDDAASRAALLNLTASLAKHLDRTGITVNTVSPGIVVTPGVRGFIALKPAAVPGGEDGLTIEASILTEVLGNPAGRLGRLEEVAGLVAFAARPLADYINGANCASTAAAPPSCDQCRAQNPARRSARHALHTARQLRPAGQ